MSNVHTRGILSTLSISSWDARRQDKQLAEEAAKLHGSKASRVRANKSLMPESAPSYEALKKAITQLRQFHYDNTLPWNDAGDRFVPIKNHTAYSDGIRTRFHDLDSLLNSFAYDYPDYKEAAKVELNGLWRDADYPRDVRALFSWSLAFNPVPSSGHYYVELSEEELEVIRQSTESQVTARFESAQKDAVKRLHDTVAAIHERLSKPEAIFRDSLIENARAVCDVLTRINIADDPELERLRKETESLAVSEPQTLRDVPEVRIDVANRAQSILDAMTATYGNDLFA